MQPSQVRLQHEPDPSTYSIESLPLGRGQKPGAEAQQCPPVPVGMPSLKRGALHWRFHLLIAGSSLGIPGKHEPLPTVPLCHSVSVLGGFSIYKLPPNSLSPRLLSCPPHSLRAAPTAASPVTALPGLQLQGSPSMGVSCHRIPSLLTVPSSPPLPRTVLNPALFHSPRASCQLKPGVIAVTSPDPLTPWLCLCPGVIT